MDLMASSANVQVDPSGRSLPFYSRYYIATARNTDVFAQHIGRDPIANSEVPLNLITAFEFLHMRYFLLSESSQNV